MVVDPVCKMDLGEPERAKSLGAEVISHGGHEHFFCSPTCRRAFEKEPKRYH